jgi:predicted glycosyltransferase
MGLGHLRRNIAIARALVESPLHASVLILSGVREAASVRLPERTDCLTLPSLEKQNDGTYRSRSLALGVPELIHMRSLAIRGALESFAPHAFVVDKNPLGVFGELEPALAGLAAKGQTRCVLGLRDVLDEPAVVDREWRKTRGTESVRRFYDAVWVYGDPAVYDPLREVSGAACVASQLSFTGYLGPRQRELDPVCEAALRERLGIPADRIFLCLLGGGQDGWELASRFARAALPEDAVGVIVTGPFMPRAAGSPPRRRSTRACACSSSCTRSRS